MIDDVSNRIKNILKQQQNTQKSHMLYKGRSPSRSNSIYSNQSIENHGESLHQKAMFPPPRSKSSSKLEAKNQQQMQIKSNHILYADSKQNNDFSIKLIHYPENNTLNKKMTTEDRDKFEFLETFNENQNKIFPQQRSHMPNQNMNFNEEEQEDSDQINIVQEMIQENNKLYLLPAFQELQERIMNNTVAKINAMVPQIFLKLSRTGNLFKNQQNQQGLHSEFNKKKSLIQSERNKIQQIENVPNIESIFYELQSDNKEDDLLFTPKIRKTIKSQPQQSVLGLLSEHIQSQKQAQQKLKQEIIKLTDKLDKVQKQISIMKKPKRQSQSQKNQHNELKKILSQIQLLKRKVTEQQQNIMSLVKKNKQQKNIIESDWQKLQEQIQDNARKSFIQEYSRNKCKCQSIVNQILKSQRYLMMELKCIKHFSSQSDPKGRTSISKKYNKQKQNNQENQILKKLKNFCHTDSNF